MKKPIFRQRRLYQHIAEHLGQRIQSGEFAPRCALPAESTLAADYGVSRNVMREALVALEILGMVTVRAGAGAFVIDASDPIDLSLAKITATAGPSPLAILEARRAIEGEIAFYAALNAKKTEVKNLASLLELAAKGTADDLDAAGWPGAFHINLAKATHNPVFVVIIEGLWQAVAGPMFAGLRAQISLSQIESRLKTRKRILKCVQQGKSEDARTAMHAHIDMVIHDLYSHQSNTGTGQPMR